MTVTHSRIVAPALPLIPLSDARDQCRVTEASEDYLMTAYVAAVTEYLDARSGVLGEALVTQTWRAAMDAVPFGPVELPVGPVQSVVEIKYVDPLGAVQTFSPTNYRLAGNIVELVSGASWPTVDARSVAFWIDYVTGYGSPSSVPATIRQVALMMIADLYDGRASVSGSAVQMSESFKYLLASGRSERGLF